MAIRTHVTAASGTSALLLAGFWISTVATPAFAQATCTYNLASGTVAVTIASGEMAALAVEGDGADLDPAAPDGAILLSVNSGAWFACGSATNSNTVSIVVLGSPGTDETFVLDNFSGAGFATPIVWSIDLVSGSDDLFFIHASEDTGDAVVLTNSTFTLNGGGGDVLGADVDQVFGEDGIDLIDGSALSSIPLNVGSGGLAIDDIFGGANDDTLAGDGGDDTVGGARGDDVVDEGAASNGRDVLTGGSGGENDCGDTVIYAARTVSVNVSSDSLANDGEAGELDAVGADFEILVAGSGNDTLSDTLVIAQRLQGGAGDDALTGNGDDTADFLTSSAPVTVDLGSGTATGDGTDVISGVNGVIGSPGDDTIIGSAGRDRLSGDGGDDTINGGAGNDLIGDNAAIGSAFPNCQDDSEFGSDILRGGLGNDVLRGGSGDDILNGGRGNDLLNGGTGNDFLQGGPGNDLLSGGPGIDVCRGGPGIDTIAPSCEIIS